MPYDVVPLKFIIGLRENHHADHPDWKLLPTVIASGLGDNYPIGPRGGGWFYDKTSGHQEETADSPIDTQLGMILLWPQIAAEAVAQWPLLATVLNDADAATFYESKATIRIPTNKVVADELTALKAEYDLAKAVRANTSGITARIRKALDPDDPTVGVRRIAEKNWDGLKAKMDLNIVGLP